MPTARILIAALLLGICPGIRAADGDPVCPLTDKQQDEATTAFKNLYPIFTQPRCFNCHGRVSPFGKGRGTHPVSAFKILPVGGPEDLQKTFEQCVECHEIRGPGEEPKWRLAPFQPEDTRWGLPSDMTSIKPLLELCEQQKKLFAGKAEDFVAHMDNDRGRTQFLTVAFEGGMGLTPAGLEQVSKGVTVPDPIRGITRADIKRFSKEWVEGQGGDFHEPKRCGCVPMEYALRVKFHGVFAPRVGGAMIRFDFETQDSDAQPALIPIHFQDGGTISGSGTLPGSSAGMITSSPASCQTGGNTQVGAIVSGFWPALQKKTDPQAVRPDPGSSKLEVKLDTSLQAAHAAGECVDFLGRVYKGSSDKPGPGVYSLNFSLDPVVGVTQTVPWNVPLPGWTGSAQVTLVRLK